VTSRIARLGHVLGLLVVIAGLCAPEISAAQRPANAEPAAYSENDVKAAFLYNFGGYVQWPASQNTPDAITFAVLNAPSIEAALRGFVEGRTLQGRPVHVRRLRSINELENDEILFIGAAENWRLPQLISVIEGPTLVVTDAPDGLSAGAMINFQLIERRVRFEVALPAAEAAGLMLSSRLLSAALRVETTHCRLACRTRGLPSFSAGVSDIEPQSARYVAAVRPDIRVESRPPAWIEALSRAKTSS
jgi:hypothetical protein